MDRESMKCLLACGICILMLVKAPVYSEVVSDEMEDEQIRREWKATRSTSFLYEKTFKVNDYEGVSPDVGEDPFEVYEGTIPILISAPHAVDHYRDDQIKPHETYTGTIVKLLCEKTGAHGIVKTYNDGNDDNFVMHTVYKDKIEQLVEEHEIQFFIDIHGMSEQYGIAIDLGTNYGYNLLGQKGIIDALCDVLRAHELSHVMVDYQHAATYPGTVSHYVAEYCKIPALQVEISKEYRRPGSDLEKFMDLLNSLEDMIQYIKEDCLIE